MYFSNFIKDDSGFTTIEYAITGALVTVSLVGVFAALGNTIAAQINRVASLIPWVNNENHQNILESWEISSLVLSSLKNSKLPLKIPPNSPSLLSHQSC